MNDSTYQELASLRLSRLNIFIGLSTLIVSLIFITVLLIVVTPLKEYIPGYGDVSSRNELIELRIKADSLEQLSAANDKYIENINNVINGNVSGTKPAPPQKIENGNLSTSTINPIAPEDAELRSEEERKEKFLVKNKKTDVGNAGSGSTKITDFYFFAPIKGTLTSVFNVKANHFGVDIASKKAQPIKSVLDGVVIVSDWSADNGYVLAIQHSNNIISVYKHNSVLYKKIGNFVKAGEVIAVTGNSGELSRGPHLHFEMWVNGRAVNPMDYINFN